NFQIYDYVLEVHFNSAVGTIEDGKNTGTEIYVHKTEKIVSAEENILAEMKTLGFKNRGIEERDDLLVMNYCKGKQGVSYALLEVCFISDLDDIKIYFPNRSKVADAIARGIAKGYGISAGAGTGKVEVDKRIYKINASDIEYIGYFYGKNGNESIKAAYTRIAGERGRVPDYFFNAELFDFSTRKAASDVVCGGNVHRLTESIGIAFPDNKKAVFAYKNNVGAKDYVGAYPVLIRNGKAETTVPAGLEGSRGRTAIGVDSAGNVYVALIPDGDNDMTLSSLRSAFIAAGATDAINLDGGGSTQYYAPGASHYTGRNVRGFIGIWLKKDETETKVEKYITIDELRKMGYVGVKW
ncbi:MAG: phosphodiester glycosidase family protein, partial [Oscillospiraceae bacterium]|nr:phosphodiester glycosidase family protein [Oscillospiraceae bacterium]